jgi:anhydro-N-acetylmuramic acid kinase
VALVRVSPGRAAPKIEVLGHSEFPYPKAVRAAVLQAANGEMRTAELSRLNWKLGEVYAGCVEKACVNAGVEIVRPHLNPGGTRIEMGHPELQLVGMHGQTVFHEAPGATWQIGEAAVVRERLGVPVVSDFRPADMAAGGQGAPLVPMLDYCLFASKTKNRVLLNLGGIANMTVIPAGAGIEDVIAFDTGPGNMVIDAVMQREFGKAFDRGGKFGMLGLMLEPVLMELIEERYFELPPPKSCGREQFGAAFVERFSKMCAANGGDARDMVATAVALTATTVSAAYQHFCRERMQGGVTEMIVAGGGRCFAG